MHLIHDANFPTPFASHTKNDNSCEKMSFNFKLSKYTVATYQTAEIPYTEYYSDIFNIGSSKYKGSYSIKILANKFIL